MTPRRRNRAVSAFFVVSHLVAFVGPWFFTSGEAIGVAFALALLTGLGIDLGFHRYLTHKSFETHRPLHCAIALLGLFACEGPPMMWVAFHRKHHQFTDRDGDPHSPRDGLFHAHMGWTTWLHSSAELAQLYRNYAKDLMEDPFIRFLSRTYPQWNLLLLALLAVLGFLRGGFEQAAAYVVWAFFARIVLVYHLTWAVNSACHRWGYRNYATADDSTNLWWAGILGLGGGWHNNHHRHPALAWHGHRRWELDFSGRVIWLLQRSGLAWNVRDQIPARSADASAASPGV